MTEAMAAFTSQPSLTIRAFALLLESPLYEYERILTEQKYPRREPASYRVPYYSSALAAIRRYFQSNRQVTVLEQAIAEIEASSMQEKRIEHNVRVVESFRHFRRHRRRALAPVGAQVAAATVAGVALRFRPDLLATEGQNQKYIIYNPRKAPITKEIAKTTLEMAHWVLQQNGLAVPISSLEYVDLHEKRTHRIAQVRSQTIRHARTNARMIAQMWAAL